jgi:hypothetical protein
MGLRNLVMFAAVTGGLIVALPGSASGQATPQPAAAQHTDAPYHATDMS